MIEIEKKIGPLNPEALRQKYFTKDSMNIEFRKRQMFEVNKSNRVSFIVFSEVKQFLGNVEKALVGEE